MNKILIFSENESLARQMLTLASSLNSEVCVATINENMAKALAACTSDQVIWLQGESTRLEDYARALAELAHDLGIGLVLIGATVSGQELAAQSATYLDAGLICGARQVVQGQNGLETTRIMYSGAAVKKEALRGLTVVTVPVGIYPPASQGLDASSPIRSIPVKVDSRVKQLEHSPIERKSAGLSSSHIVIGVGLGFDRQDDLKLAEELAASLHAAVGCTRPVAEDKQWLPSDMYLGISGENIHPDMYIAVGISGQVQHMAGVRDAKVIVAINKNEKAPIFKSADYGIVGDLYKVLPLLTEAIKSR